MLFSTLRRAILLISSVHLRSLELLSTMDADAGLAVEFRFLLPKPHLLITLIRAETMSFLPRLTTTRASVGLADGGNITLSLLLQMRLLICMIAFTGTESLVGGGGDDGEYLMTSGTFSNSSFFHRFFSLHL
jgi:hypothetical protein